ncbi:MAG TPA: hypothetical protein VHB48_01930 [Chitinophagaceae bacterium]|nr:hypothetical protein [Chitinophagaceae bacterium]
MRFLSYFNTALALIHAYDGSMPLAHYLKQYFGQHKKHGAKDRRYITHLCYCYYRPGHTLKDMPADQRLKTALFLCTDDIAEWGALFNEQWLNNHSLSLQQRIAFVQSLYPFNPGHIFPWQEELSSGIDKNAFALSHLVQPYLFLRARPGKLQGVTEALLQQQLPHTVTGSTITLPNATKIDTLIALNKDAVVQDYSSQQIAQLLLLLPQDGPLSVWDCCAASGGKAIMACDTLGHISLTVSDIRPSIIHNLQQRFNDAGLTRYKSFVADVSKPVNTTQYNVVICDVPCSGSGTWSRTPEQLYFFTPGKITHYTALQKSIAGNVVPHIQRGGWLLYITCSVFKAENEAMVDYLQQQGLTLIKQQLFAGYALRADTMFAALFNNQGAGQKTAPQS